ncbi:MAG: nuclear transport factor 2 family protein [Flavobacteriaceae bacterium]|nr:nuclear transport factor 2 family protein [Flavobacteriaceae bacterium]
MKIKLFLIPICFIFIFISCVNNEVEIVDNNPNYDNNLATAKKFFELFASEDIEAQKPLMCPGITHYPPFYGSEPNKFDAALAANKAWMDNFDDITYDARAWLPGTDSLGKPNGSVRTYGSWTAKANSTGNVITVRAYHYFDFNDAGQIHESGDFFDASGVMNAASAVTAIEEEK